MMKTIISKLLAAVLLTAMVTWGAGCATEVAGTPAGASEVMWDSGTLKSEEFASYDQGWNAALGAMNQFGYAVVSQEKDEVIGKITARATGDKKITVEVKKISGTVVGFGIRVDSWGDKIQSVEILKAIRQRL